MNRFSIAGAFMLGATLISPGFATGTHASEAVPASLAQKLHEQPAAFTMTEAKRRRLMMMHETMRQQRYHERRRAYGYGYRPYGRPYGAPSPYNHGRRYGRW